jgi:hypothetical protein
MLYLSISIYSFYSWAMKKKSTRIENICPKSFMTATGASYIHQNSLEGKVSSYCLHFFVLSQSFLACAIYMTEEGKWLHIIFYVQTRVI